MASTAALEKTPESGFLGGVIPITTLKPSPLNPRKRFDEDSLKELADNITKNGVIVPLVVRRQKGVGEIIDGERRYRAATLAKVASVPVIFRDDLTDGEVMEIMLLNQIQRQDLTPLEEAQGFKALIDSNPSRYSVAYIGDRIGRSEKWVWDRMKLLDLVKEAKQLLDREQILVGHAEILAKLKPEDQQRALGIDDKGDVWDMDGNGVWRSGVAALGFDEDEADDEQLDALEKARKKDRFLGLRPVTVAELQAWVNKHVRLDVKHEAAAAPLDFGPLAEKVEERLALSGRGKKVVAITFDNYVDPEARDDKEKTYGPKSWRLADGSKKTTEVYAKGKFTKVDSPTCEHSVLGTVVVGAQRGQAFDVCVARDKCQVHWKAEIAEREKNQKLRQAGKGGQANQREEQSRQKQEAERARREAEEKAWEALKPKAVAAIDDHIANLPIKALLPIIAKVNGVKVKNAEEFVRALATTNATMQSWSSQWLGQNAKRYGFDLPAWIKVQTALEAEKRLAGGKQVQAMRGVKAAKKAKKR